MKRLFVLTLTMVAGGMLQALPLGNPSEASLMTEGVCLDRLCWGTSLRAGFYGDYVFDRYLEVEGGGDIRKSELYTNAGYLALNFCDRLDLFGTVGTTQIAFHTEMLTLGSATGSNFRIELETESAFSWSVGGRATVWECLGFSLGVEGQYFRANPQINHIYVSQFQARYPDGQTLCYREWQVGVGASYFVSMASCMTAAVPYIGVMWAGSKADMGNLTETYLSSEAITLFGLESRKLWSYAVGVSLLGCGRSSVTVEGRFAGERAFYVNGQVRF